MLDHLCVCPPLAQPLSVPALLLVPCAPCCAVLPEPSRRVHVQALVRNKRPELLAEDLMATKEQLTRAREESMMAMVEKRRLEAEVIKLRSSLLKSEELLNNKERMMSPTL